MKVLVIFALVSATLASENSYSNPTSAITAYESRPEAGTVAAETYGASAAADYAAYEYAPTPYSFGYSVNDVLTYNNYAHQETGDGNGSVAGRYQVLLPDGCLQVVTYKADKYNGFVSEVKYMGEAKQDYTASPVAAKPSAAYASAPAHYASAPAKPAVQAPVQDSYYPTPATYSKPSTSAPTYNPTTQAPGTTYRTTTTYKPSTQAPAYNPTTLAPAKESYYSTQAPAQVSYNLAPGTASVAYKPVPAPVKAAAYKPVPAKPAVMKPLKRTYPTPASFYRMPVQGNLQVTPSLY